MFKKKLHLHSMMVHVIAALAPIAAVAFALLKLDVTMGFLGAKTFEVVVYSSVPLMLLVAIPSTMTGLFERDHIYAKWHSTHKIKLLFSLVLMGALLIELGMLFGADRVLAKVPMFGPLGLLIIVVNNVASTALSMYGLKISIGRQGLGKTSYEPDLFKKEPYDVLTRAGEVAREKPKYIDLYEENR